MLLHFIAGSQRATGLGYTHRLKKFELAQGAGLPLGSINTQLHRLFRLGLLNRLDIKRGRHGGGTILQIQQGVLQLLDAHDKNEKVRHKLTHETDTDSTPDGPSSGRKTPSSLRADRAIAGKLQDIVQRIGLEEDFGVAAGDLLPVWKLGRFGEDFEAFALSIEHIAFYLRSAAAQTIKSPKNWMMGQLRAGFYASPAGFVSWEEQQAEQRLAATRERLKRLHDLQKRQFEADFEVWCLERPDEELREFLKGSFVAKDPKSPAARAILRERFAELTGRPNPYAEDPKREPEVA
jgi:hypothetical protein